MMKFLVWVSANKLTFDRRFFFLENTFEYAIYATFSGVSESLEAMPRGVFPIWNRNGNDVTCTSVFKTFSMEPYIAL